MADTLTSPKSHAHVEHHDIDYLHDGSLLSWLTTVDHKKLGVMYLWSVLFMFFLGGVFALLVRLELFAPGHTIMDAETYNKVFTLHGAIMVFLFIIPSIPGGSGQLRAAADAGRQRRRVSAAESGELLDLRDRRDHGRDRDGHWRRRHRLDLLHALLHDHRRLRRADDDGGLRPRLLVDFHRPELHRHGSQAARPGHGLVRYAAVRVGHLFHRHHSGPGDAGAGDHAAAADDGADVLRSASSIPNSAAIRCCSSTSSGSIRTRPSTS